MTEYIEIVGLNHHEYGMPFLEQLKEGQFVTLERHMEPYESKGYCCEVGYSH